MIIEERESLQGNGAKVQISKVENTFEVIYQHPDGVLISFEVGSWYDANFVCTALTRVKEVHLD